MKKITVKKKLMWLVLAILVSVIVILLYGDETAIVPDVLYGNWTTTDSNYANRYFKLSKDTVTFGHGEYDLIVYTVSSINGKREGDRIIYTVNFIDDEGVEYSQTLYFNQNYKNLLMFKNQKGIVWHKDPE